MGNEQSKTKQSIRRDEESKQELNEEQNEKQTLESTIMSQDTEANNKFQNTPTRKPPPKVYKCHKCQMIGDHWIMNCQKKDNKSPNKSANKSVTKSPPNSNKNKVPDQITIYWDYETMPMNKSTNFIALLTTLKTKLWSSIGFKLPIEIIVYHRISKLTQHIQNAFDINGIIQIPVPDSVSKRMIVDILLCVYELKRDHKTRAFGLISSDVDFAHLFSKIQPTIVVFYLCIILLRNIDINNAQCLSNNVHKIIQLNCCDIINDSDSDNTSIELNVNETKKCKRKVKKKKFKKKNKIKKRYQKK
eukprot:310682_1